MVNKQLLEWAVNNIESWPEGWTHLRADFSVSPVFYTKTNRQWNNNGRYWTSNNIVRDSDWVSLGKTIEGLPCPQVITKEEWQAARNKKNSIFTQEMLVPGLHVVEYANGRKYLVIQANLAIEYKQEKDIGWVTTEDLFNPTCSEWTVVKVYETKKLDGYYCYGDDRCLTLIWERSPELPIKKELKKLREQYKLLGEKIAAVEKASLGKS